MLAFILSINNRSTRMFTVAYGAKWWRNSKVKDDGKSLNENFRKCVGTLIQYKRLTDYFNNYSFNFPSTGRGQTPGIDDTGKLIFYYSNDKILLPRDFC